MFRLDGKVALVTGAARGIGAGIAVSLARAGAAAVIVNDLSETAEAEATGRDIEATGARFLLAPADVRSEADVESMFSAVDRQFGRLDILVSNAGITRREDIFETTLQSWHDVVDTHLTGFFLCARAAMFRMREQRSGRIIVNSSVTAWRGAIRGFVHYTAAKAGQIGIVHTLARTAAPLRHHCKRRGARCGPDRDVGNRSRQGWHLCDRPGHSAGPRNSGRHRRRRCVPGQ